MNEILLSTEVLVYLLSEVVLYGLLLVALVMVAGIIKGWNFDAFTPKQFALEQRAYLVMSVLFFVLLLKLLLLPYFVYTIDRLSVLVPGAMCGAGVIKANVYGNPLLTLKIIILFLSGFWLALNRLDLQAQNYPYMKGKAWLYMILFGLLTAELALDILYFTHIETTNPVSCCSVIFGQLGGGNGLPFGLDIPKLLLLFYLLYLLFLLTLDAHAVVRIVVTLLFSVSSYYSLVYFFGTYIYQLPTHQCPFCMLQKEYYYVGYLLWGALLSGTFFSLLDALQKHLPEGKLRGLTRVSVACLTLFVVTCSAYVAVYYLRNGVLL